MRRLRFTAVVPVVASTLLAGIALAGCSTNTTPETPKAPEVPARFAQQSLAWQPCAEKDLAGLPPSSDLSGLECATFLAPHRWDRLGEGKDVTVAVSRLRSTADATASVFTNPGGPGGPGRWYPISFRGQEKLREHQEIIGVDTRGTGRSTAVTCQGTISAAQKIDALDRDPRNLAKIMDTVEKAANTCEQASGEMSSAVSTAQNIADMDLLRALLGREKINFVGTSAGTWLGAHYAQKFPDRTGRFVLDSNTEFTNTWQKSFDRQPAGFEKRWNEDFLPWLAKANSKYGFGATVEEVQQNYDKLRAAQAAESPAKAMELDDFPIQLLYSKASFPILATVLTGAKAATDAGAPSAAAPPKDPAKAADDEASLATQWTTVCNDGRYEGDREGAIRQSQEFNDKDLKVIGSRWLDYQMCRFWKGEPHPLPKMDGQGVPPVLMVQSENDPATPIEGARAAHKAFANSRMITVTGDGDHGVYNTGNAALDKVVNDFLLGGEIPQDQNIAGMPLPAP